MTCSRTSPGNEAHVPQEFMYEQNLHRVGIIATEDMSVTTAAQIPQYLTAYRVTGSKIMPDDCLQYRENSLSLDHTAGNFETEAEDERRRLEGISLRILNDPSASVSNVPRVSSAASPGRLKWNSKYFPAGKSSSLEEEEEEKRSACENSARSTCHGVTHYHAGSAAVKRLEENIDRFSGLVEVLQNHCNYQQSRQCKAYNTTQAPEEIPEVGAQPTIAASTGQNDIATPRENGAEEPQDMKSPETSQRGFLGRVIDHIIAGGRGLLRLVPGSRPIDQNDSDADTVNDAQIAATQPEASEPPGSIPVTHAPFTLSYGVDDPNDAGAPSQPASAQASARTGRSLRGYQASDKRKAAKRERNEKHKAKRADKGRDED